MRATISPRWSVTRGSAVGVMQQSAAASWRRRVLAEAHGAAHGQLARGLAELGGALDDLVVDVGDVADVGDLGIAASEVAVNDVVGHERARVADVERAVDGGPANVHAYVLRVGGLELHLAPAQGVVDAEGHGAAV
jgi:hypothetical protein